VSKKKTSDFVIHGTPLYAACQGTGMGFGPAADRNKGEYVGGGDGHAKVVRLLLDAGASVDKGGAHSTRPLKEIRDVMGARAPSKPSLDECTPLMVAVRQRCISTVCVLLEHSADPNCMVSLCDALTSFETMTSLPSKHAFGLLRSNILTNSAWTLQPT
jgi:ankyrin repeat protein